MKPILVLCFTLHFAASHMIAQGYFQQQVNYTINVTLNDRENTLTGFESVEYINHSPDRLKYIYFHLWPNAYKDRSTAFAQQLLENGRSDFYFARESERGYMDSVDFKVDGISTRYIVDFEYADICKVILPDTLMPGDSVTITTPFFVKIPKNFSRLGHNGQSYQITQWYPKPAVYDVHGWNQMPYLDQGEFYAEYGSFDVSITLPKNYVVGATGNLVTEEENQWLEQKVRDTTMISNFPASDRKLKTIRFTENKIHDFAWFADKRYHVLKGKVTLGNGKTVTTWAMFTREQSSLWKNAIEYVDDALKYYSDWYGDYPYNNCTAVYGSILAGGAMEYPGITVVGNADSERMLEEMIIHEVGHNWFYGILGFNERKYPYLDEGINTFSEFRYFRVKYPGLKFYQWLYDMGQTIPTLANVEEVPYSELYIQSYAIQARVNKDQPMNLNSEAYSELNYGLMVYYKSGLVFTYLMQYLGEDEFNRIMHGFYNQWKFKHPGPDNLRLAFESNSHKDISVFFNELMATTEHMDYSVKRVKPEGVLIKNKGTIASPVSVTTFSGANMEQKKWFPGFEGKKWLDIPVGSADRVVLFDSDWPPEINRKNNTLKTHGLLKSVEPLNIHPIQIIEKPDKTLIGVFPVVGWNNYNKAMLGILLYNPLLPQQTFEYQLMPLYGTGNHDIAGSGRMAVNFTPNCRFFRYLQFSVEGRRYGYGLEQGNSYNRSGAGMTLVLRNANVRSRSSKIIRLNGATASQHTFESSRDFGKIWFLALDADYSNNHLLHPYRVNWNAEKSNSYLKSSLTVNYQQAIKGEPDFVEIRLYAAALFSKTSKYNDFYGLQLSGNSGIHDYRYQELFLGRFERMEDRNRQNLLSQQFVMNEGGFVSNIPSAFSNRWMATAGLTVKIPGTPVCFFANAGSYSGASDNILYQSAEKTITSETIPYEAGAMLNLFRFIKIYFPVVTSRDISEVNDVITDNYWQTIRYSINFNLVNPFELKRLFVY